MRLLVWIRLTVEGTPGHGSMPLDDNPCLALVRALEAITGWERPFEIRETVRPLWDLLKAKGLVPAAEDQETLARVAARDRFLHAMLVDTVSITKLDAGYKTNVIPSSATAELDCRLLPGTRPEEFLATLKRLVDNPAVGFEVLLQRSAEGSPNDSELLRVSQEVLREHIEDGLLVPVMSVGFTDSVTLRALGIPAYGYQASVLTSDEHATIHGHDERLSIENLRLGCQVTFEVVRRLCS